MTMTLEQLRRQMEATKTPIWNLLELVESINKSKSDRVALVTIDRGGVPMEISHKCGVFYRIAVRGRRVTDDEMNQVRRASRKCDVAIELGTVTVRNREEVRAVDGKRWFLVEWTLR